MKLSMTVSGLAALAAAGLGMATAPAASAVPAVPMKAACAPARPGYDRCFALYAPQRNINAAIRAGMAALPAPPLWGARDIESAYKLPVSRNPHQTVAVVDAYDAPGLAADLAVYRRHYGLGPCTVVSGCLKVVNQDGKSSPLPSSGVDNGWALETTLDVSMVSAACPRCRILVVESASNSDINLAAAENTAARLGAQVISNSYGEPESGRALSHAAAYRHPGHTVVVSSGDLGFGQASFPADLGTVTAVGGTQLARAKNRRGWSERTWSSPQGDASASGCSAYAAKPSWQHDPHCAMRTVADVSALASDVSLYAKVYGGWQTVSGTSAAAPLIAGIYGLAGNAATIKPGREYSRRGSLFDITTGSNVAFGGQTCGGDYLCRARKGYDAPTGLGTPNGTGAF